MLILPSIPSNKVKFKGTLKFALKMITDNYESKFLVYQTINIQLIVPEEYFD